MGKDPNQPYPGQYGQPGEQGGYQAQGGPQQQQEQTGAHYQQPYGQQPGAGYQQPYGQPGFQQIYNTGHPLGQSSMSPPSTRTYRLAQLATPQSPAFR